MAENTLLEKVLSLQDKYRKLEESLADPAVIADMKKFVQLNKDYKELQPIIQAGLEYKRLLDELNVPCVPVTVPGRLRENLKIYDDYSGELTEINESGSPVTEEALKNFLGFVRSALPKTSVLVIGGSVPPGTPKDIYARVIRIAKDKNVPTVLDASGELLKEGLAARPTLIKPNREDMERLCGRRIDSVQTAREEAEKLVREGIHAVCLSLDADGAVYANREGVWYSRGVPIQVRGQQGAGDAMVAGLCDAFISGKPPEQVLASGIAAAEGSLMREGTLLCTKEQYEILLPRIRVERLA
jgi:1-phosphofructokinase